jgi:hypothetical protein
MQMQIQTRNDFVKLLKDNGLNGFAAEIGVANGSYSEHLISNGLLEKLYLIDPWKDYGDPNADDGDKYGTQSQQDEKYNCVVRKFSFYGDRVEVLRKESVAASALFENNYFDFIYIDANHSYDSVKSDICAWYPKLKYNGILAGHDYFVGRFGRSGVKQAVDDFCFSSKNKLYITGGTKRCPPSWYFSKEC